jgi:hypothetical protein
MMGIKKHCTALALLFVAGFCHAADVDVGVVKIDADGHVKLFTTANPGKRVIQLQYPGADGAIQCCVKATLGAELVSDVSASDQSGGKEVHAFALKTGKALEHADPFIGVAVIGDKLKLERGTQHKLIVHGEAQTSELDTCLSHEGVHMTWLAKDKTLAHLYLGLGYDVEPTCAESVYQQ